MTPINPRWTKWIIASITKHFHTKLQIDAGIQTTDPGRRYKLSNRDSQHCEVRVDGPRFKEISRAYFNAYVEVNIFMNVDIDREDILKMPTLMGIVQNAMTQPITVYKFGNDAEDDGSKVCCLVLVDSSNKKEAVETNNFGQIDPNVPLHQAACEAHYELESDFINC